MTLTVSVPLADRPRRPGGGPPGAQPADARHGCGAHGYQQKCGVPPHGPLTCAFLRCGKATMTLRARRPSERSSITVRSRQAVPLESSRSQQVSPRAACAAGGPAHTPHRGPLRSRRTRAATRLTSASAAVPGRPRPPRLVGPDPRPPGRSPAALPDAADTCRHAAELSPLDPVPWVILLGILRLLGRPAAELRPVWQEITDREPWNREAHLCVLGYLSRGECGSAAQVLDFVEGVRATAPDRSPVTGPELAELVDRHHWSATQGGLEALTAHHLWSRPHAARALGNAAALRSRPGHLTHAGRPGRPQRARVRAGHGEASRRSRCRVRRDRWFSNHTALGLAGTRSNSSRTGTTSYSAESANRCAPPDPDGVRRTHSPIDLVDSIW